MRFPGWCNLKPAVRLLEPHIAFPYTDTRPSTGPKRTQVISSLRSRWHTPNPLTSPLYLLCSHGVTLEEKLGELCVLFGCVARAAVPVGNNKHAKFSKLFLWKYTAQRGLRFSGRWVSRESSIFSTHGRKWCKSLWLYLSKSRARMWSAHFLHFHQGSSGLSSSSTCRVSCKHPPQAC